MSVGRWREGTEREGDGGGVWAQKAHLIEGCEPHRSSNIAAIALKTAIAYGYGGVCVGVGKDAGPGHKGYWLHCT